MSLNASEASMQNDTQRQQPPFTAKRTTVTTDRKADAEAGHRRCFSQDYIPSEISQCGASAIAAHCISHRSTLHQHLQRTAPGTCSVLHPAHRPSAILTAPAIQRLHNKPATPSHQVSQSFQTLPPHHPSHFKPIPLSLPDSPHHPSPSAQSPPSSPPTSVRLPTRNCRFTYPPLPSSIPTMATRFPYPAPRPATAHKKTAPNPVEIVL